MIKLYNDDCFNAFKNIEDNSVDLVLCDPPYGTVKGLFSDGTEWDNVLDHDKIWAEINRVLRFKGTVILFSQEPFTSNLIHSQINNIPFCYRMIWLKNQHGNHLMSNIAPLNYFEDICVFSKKYETVYSHPLRKYTERLLKDFLKFGKTELNKKFGNRKAEHFFRYDSQQFSICNEEIYNELINKFSIDEYEFFLNYDTIVKIDKEYKEKYNKVFNLQNDEKYKKNVLEYSKDKTIYHPTQKPVKLLEDLIKTYSHENDLILDYTMRSGSTGVACCNTNRNFIGIEKDTEYFNIAKKRIIKEV